MSKTERFDYYRAYSQQAGYAHELACNLHSAVLSGELGTRELLDALHAMENDADHVNHQIHERLLTDFTVPLERDDMGDLAHVLDDVCDALEDVAMRAYCYHCTSLGSGGRKILALLPECTGALLEAVDSLGHRSNWRDGRMKERLLRVQDLESAADVVYVDALHDLYGNAELDAGQRQVARDVLQTLEDAMDACEAAAECIFALMTANL
ncbi:MAG: DUF47 family protein [Coriobacteriia bacterium]|nr:DUF47 family protein [Coriobacteriia bacterium]